MKKLGVIFGGMSTENKVSCVSGASVIKNLNKEKYEIYRDFSKKNPKIFNENMEDISKEFNIDKNNISK